LDFITIAISEREVSLYRCKIEYGTPESVLDEKDSKTFLDCLPLNTENLTVIFTTGDLLKLETNILKFYNCLLSRKFTSTKLQVKYLNQNVNPLHIEEFNTWVMNHFETLDKSDINRCPVTISSFTYTKLEALNFKVLEIGGFFRETYITLNVRKEMWVLCNHIIINAGTSVSVHTPNPNMEPLSVINLPLSIKKVIICSTKTKNWVFFYADKLPLLEITETDISHIENSILLTENTLSYR
jgi:hypothetical protein